MAGSSQQRLAYLDAIGIRTWVPREYGPQSGQSLASDAARVIEPAPGPASTAQLAGEPAARSVEQRAKHPAGSVPDLRLATSAATAEPPQWARLRQVVAECRSCDLCQSRTQTVFGVGDRQASWMIIGEAPGADEDRQGEPFVGRAGQLLTAMLMAAGFQRHQVFISNVLKCRPPDNRDPHQDEMAACSSYLEKQIEMIRPDLILAVGRIAAQHLLQTDMPVGRLRGIRHIHATTSTPVVVTYHPAYLLRKPSEKAKVWDDLRLARTCAGQSA